MLSGDPGVGAVFAPDPNTICVHHFLLIKISVHFIFYFKPLHSHISDENHESTYLSLFLLIQCSFFSSTSFAFFYNV